MSRRYSHTARGRACQTFRTFHHSHYARFLEEVRRLRLGLMLIRSPRALCNIDQADGNIFEVHIPFKGHAVAGDFGMYRGFAAK